MKSSRTIFSFLLASLLLPTLTQARSIDMDDPRRALGREDDVRVDAQLLQDSVSASCTLTVTYQIQNLSDSHVAVADLVSDVSFDSDSETITIGIGSEIPQDGMMPRMNVIAPGEKKTSTLGAPVRLVMPSMRSPFISVPRYVQVKVSILRDLEPFQTLLASQAGNPRPQRLDDEQFEQWLEGNDTIFLNTIPVYWNPGPAAAERRHGKAKF
jgi:hypothetical protein